MGVPRRSGRSGHSVGRLARVEGTGGLGDAQLLALVLGTGSGGLPPLGLAQSLLSAVGGLAQLGRMRLGGLVEQPGLSASRAARLVAAIELGKRAERETFRDSPRKPLTASRVAEWAIPRLGGLEHEEVWVLCVDATTTLKSTWQVGRGGAHGCALIARDVLVPVVRDAAAGFVLVHNHPSGDPSPSREDLVLTQALVRAGTTLSTPLLDHVIVGRGGYRSLLESGQL